MNRNKAINVIQYPIINEQKFIVKGNTVYYPPSRFEDKVLLDDEGYVYYDRSQERRIYHYLCNNILYRTNYSSLTANFVFKWEYKQGSNLYFIYSLYKDVSGVSFNNLTELIDYKYNEGNNTEIFFDKSLYLKIDYWFDI